MEGDPEDSNIEIRDIPQELNEIMFLMLLENSFDGYEQVSIREFNTTSRTATISIKNPHIAEKVLNDGCLKWENKEMRAKRVSVDKHEQDDEDSHPAMKTVQLTGACESIAKEKLMLYLESERYGGGKVKEFQAHSSGFLVTFEDANVARRFSSRDHEFCTIKLQAALLESWPMTNGSCAIEVYVHDDGGSIWGAQMIIMLLESPRHGGSPEIVEEVFEDADDLNRVVVTLKKHDNVECIIRKTNGKITIGQSVLTLKILSTAKPPTFVENPDKKKLLFLELNPQCLVDKEALKTFIEKCSKASVQQLLFCSESDCVLVQFKDEPDYRNILSVLCCKPFKGTMISVQRISKTKQIQVTGWKDHDDIIEIYFEKHGGQVENVCKNGDGVLIITFKDFDSVDKVLSMANELSKSEISIAPHIEAFEGKSFEYLDPPPLVPNDIKIPIKKEIYGFLLENRQYIVNIENELAKLKCSIHWPSSPLNLEAILMWNDKDIRCQNVKSWSSEVKTCFKEKIEEYDCCEIPVCDDVFNFVAAETRKFKPGKTKILKKIDENNKKISVVGLKCVIQEFRSFLDKQGEIARNVDDKLIKFNQPQFLLLTKSGFIENFKKTFKITVSESKSDYTMLLKGPTESIKACQLKLAELKNKIKEEELAVFGKYPEFFKREDVMNKIEKEFQSKKIVAILSDYSDTLLLYSFEHLSKAQDCLSSMFKVEEFEIDKSEKEAMKYREWSAFAKDLNSKFKEPFTWSLSGDKVRILASSKEVDELVKEFHKYFKEHAKVTETFMKPQSVVDFLIKTNEFIEIKTRARALDVQIKEELGSALQLSGKRANVVAIMDDLEQFCSKIVSRTHQLEYKAKNLFEPQASNTLMGICGKCKVDINLKNSKLNHERYEEVASSTRSGDCKINVICGFIVDQRTDVIFNCCPSNLELSHSAISKALLDAAGFRLQDDLKSRCETKRLSPGEIVETPGYKLHCDSIYHGYITPWNKNNYESEKAIRLLIKNSLEKASRDKKSSISFPGFGTGKLGVPHDKAAKVMIEEANSFISRPSSLKEIRFVIYEKDEMSIQAFKRECSQADSGNKASSADDNTLLNMNGVCLKVLNRDLLEEKCDAIVNSTNHNLAVEGAVGALTKAIMDKAGDKVKKECADLKSLKNGLAMTSSGNLSNCKHIFHVSGKDVPGWEKVISDMLEEANKKRIGSIAMPLLGTGHQKITVDEIARVILQCFKNFAKTKNSSLKELKIMIPNTTIHSKFKEAFHGLITSASERKGRPSSHENKVEIEIYGLNEESLKKAIDEIHKELSKVVTEKKITHRLTDIPPNLFAKIETKHDVKITSSKDTIKIVGKTDISDAVEEVNELVKEQMQKEFKSMEMETFTKYVTWSYRGKDGKSITFGYHSTYLLEKAFQTQDPGVHFTDKSGVKHDVDFKTMKDTINGKLSTDVSRTLKGEITLPSCWTDMSKTSIVELVLLNAKSTEYNMVQNLFHVGMLKPAIVKIERIQNPSLYKQYECKKGDMETKNKGIEKRVWHGTRPVNVPNINANNFNRALGNQGSYGVGVYFAINPDYSIQSYCLPDQTGLKSIYLAKVLVGQVGKGMAGLKEPPELNPVTKERFDSVADNPASPSMYVIFYDCQMYPEYLITFK